MTSTSNYQSDIEDIQWRIEQGKIRLPSYPKSLLKIRDAFNDPDVTYKALAQLISTDPVLANKIYQIAKSPLYQLDTNNRSLSEVLPYFGIRELRTITYNHSLSQLYNQRQFKKEARITEIVRNQSVGVGALAGAIARHFAQAPPANAVLAGLLHNIGALMIITWYGQVPQRKQTHDEKIRFVLAAQEFFSECIAEHWDVSLNIKLVLKCEVDESEYSRQELMLYHLIKVTRWTRIYFQNSDCKTQPPESSLKAMNLSVDELNSSKELLIKEMVKTVKFLN